MNQKTKVKLIKNNLLLTKLTQLDPMEKKDITNSLLKSRTQQALADELGVSRSTVKNWLNPERNNSDAVQRVSIIKVIKTLNERLEGYKPRLDEFEEFEKLRKKVEDILHLRYGK